MVLRASFHLRDPDFKVLEDYPMKLSSAIDNKFKVKGSKEKRYEGIF